ncbi:MAG: type toxin-antitoxin system prevent-host-death family antitoxin [Sphingomonas bacterium]|uniref:type II toxin-antitoxin system Phd/YefM family antitoxin n=1 Tax=Sphingomonas bacterium TaxID=1895847 RepID=UPI00263553C5|nr:type II toxin-antitoxin system prevent-host-death family antitoxin [Sphingomonas bacterium]MDB5709878.1 type toxin-antitoxin system prevent-host-death family antitoxin [Sphingomonas bacterium]
MAEADPRKPVVNVHDAKTHLSKLLDRVLAGEEIILAKAGKPYAKLVPISDDAPPPRQGGQLKGLVGEIPDSVWFDPLYSKEELDAFAGEHLLSDRSA